MRTAVDQIQLINSHIQTVLAEVRTLATNSEVNSIAPPNHNSTLADADPDNQVSGDTSQLNVTANETFDRMNNSIDKLQHTLESNLQKKVAIKRDYKLTNKRNFNTWLDSLNSELALNDLKEIIDQHEKFANDNTEIVVKQKQLIRDIIINHIDDHYHKKILGITEPNIILKKIIEARQLESNTTKTTAKQKLYNMKQTKSHSALEFCDKFDEILKELDTCNQEAPISEDEEKSIFYHTVKNTSPVLVSTRMVRNQTGTDMTYEEMKNCILQTDAERVNINFDMTPEAAARANAVIRGKRLEIQRRRENTCNRCNRVGYWMADCPWKGTDKWFCYKCNGNKNHNLKQCPEKVQRYDGQNNYKNRGRGMSSGRSRGGRGNRGSRGKQRFHPYKEKNNKNNGGNNQSNTKVRQAGETDLTYNTTKNISFIADSGPTEHNLKRLH